MVDGREGSRPPRRKGKNLASRQRDERQVPPVCLHRACESLGMVVTRRFWVPGVQVTGHVTRFLTGTGSEIADRAEDRRRASQHCDGCRT